MFKRRFGVPINLFAAMPLMLSFSILARLIWPAIKNEEWFIPASQVALTLGCNVRSINRKQPWLSLEIPILKQRIMRLGVAGLVSILIGLPVFPVKRVWLEQS